MDTPIPAIDRWAPIVLDEFRALPLRPAVMEKWLWHNAARVLGESS
jgi:predicted TIM-barrel fold metal-dependent hydrolase